MKNYKEGYWTKIQYWTNKLNEAIIARDLRAVDHCHCKLDYFIQREWDTNEETAPPAPKETPKPTKSSTKLRTNQVNNLTLEEIGNMLSL